MRTSGTTRRILAILGSCIGLAICNASALAEDPHAAELGTPVRKAGWSKYEDSPGCRAGPLSVHRRLCLLWRRDDGRAHALPEGRHGASTSSTSP